MSSPSLLVISVNVQCFLEKKKPIIDINTVVRSIVYFSNAYATQNRSNRLVILAQLKDTVEIIFPSQDIVILPPSLDSTLIPIQQELSKIITQKLVAVLLDAEKRNESQNNSATNSDVDKATSIAFSKSLCLINRHQAQFPGLLSRILILQFAEDLPLNYNSLMNAVFRYGLSFPASSSF